MENDGLDWNWTLNYNISILKKNICLDGERLRVSRPLDKGTQ